MAGRQPSKGAALPRKNKAVKRPNPNAVRRSVQLRTAARRAGVTISVPIRPEPPINPFEYGQRSNSNRKQTGNPGKDLMSEAEARQRIRGANRTGQKSVKNRKGVVAKPHPINPQRNSQEVGMTLRNKQRNRKKK